MIYINVYAICVFEGSSWGKSSLKIKNNRKTAVHWWKHPYLKSCVQLPRLLLLWNTSIYIKTTIEVRLECTGWRFAWRTSCSNVLESEFVGVVYIFVRWFLLDCNRSLQEIPNFPHIERVLLNKRHNGSGKKLKEPADDWFNVLGETVYIWKYTGGLG